MVGQLDGKNLDRDHVGESQSERQPKQIAEAIIRPQLTARARRVHGSKECPLLGRPNPRAGRPTGRTEAPKTVPQPHDKDRPAAGRKRRQHPAKARFVLSSLKRYAARLKAEPKKPLLVLVVDDDRAVRDFVDRVLREAGYRTMVAASGPEAIELARKERIDLLLTDVNMPQMTGDELARRLRHDEPSLKVLYLTGFSDQLFDEKTTLWQDEAYLEKPCTIAGLLQAVALLTVGHVQST